MSDKKNLIPVDGESSEGRRPSSAYDISRQKSRLSETYDERAHLFGVGTPPNAWIITGAIAMLVVGLVSCEYGISNHVSNL